MPGHLTVRPPPCPPRILSKRAYSSACALPCTMHTRYLTALSRRRAAHSAACSLWSRARCSCCCCWSSRCCCCCCAWWTRGLAKVMPRVRAWGRTGTQQSEEGRRVGQPAQFVSDQSACVRRQEGKQQVLCSSKQPKLQGGGGGSPPKDYKDLLQP